MKENYLKKFLLSASVVLLAIAPALAAPGDLVTVNFTSDATAVGYINMTVTQQGGGSGTADLQAGTSPASAGTLSFGNVDANCNSNTSTAMTSFNTGGGCLYYFNDGINASGFSSGGNNLEISATSSDPHFLVDYSSSLTTYGMGSSSATYTALALGDFNESFDIGVQVDNTDIGALTSTINVTATLQ